MCTACINGTQDAFRAINTFVQGVQTNVSHEVVRAYTIVTDGLNDLRRTVHGVALLVFKAINDILKNTDPTSNALKLFTACVELGETLGFQVAHLHPVSTALRTVTSFVSAKGIFQKFDAFARTSIPTTAPSLAKVVGISAFAVADGIGFAKWCSDNRLMSGRWFNQHWSVLGQKLPITAAKVQTAAVVCGFATGIYGAVRSAWNNKAFSLEISLDLAANVSKLAATLLSQVQTAPCKALATLATAVGNASSLALFLLRRDPPAGAPTPVACCSAPRIHAA